MMKKKTKKKTPAQTQHIVKRRGHAERFDERKVYASVYAACLNAHILHEKAEKMADKVAAGIKKWLACRKTVTSEQIFRETATLLKKQNADASFMYETHRDIC